MTSREAVEFICFDQSYGMFNFWINLHNFIIIA